MPETDTRYVTISFDVMEYEHYNDMCEDSGDDCDEIIKKYIVKVTKDSGLHKKIMKVFWKEIEAIDNFDVDDKTRAALLTDIQENRHDCIENNCVKLKFLVSGKGKLRKNKIGAINEELSDGYFCGQPDFKYKKKDYIALWNLE